VIKRALLIGLLALSLSGCVVQSLNPFYTQDIVVAMPAEMKGEWVLNQIVDSKSKDDDVLFMFTEDNLLYQDKAGKYDLRTVYFKMGDQLFVDLVIQSEQPNNRTVRDTLSVHPHSLVKVVLDNNEVQLWWPNAGSLKWLAEEQKVKFFTGPEDVTMGLVLIGETEEIVRFLKNIKDDPDSFGEGAEKWSLKRSAK